MNEWIFISIFLIAILVIIGIAFMALGVSYIAIGLANRDKWKNKEKLNFSNCIYCKQQLSINEILTEEKGKANI
jgi:hypothetical protein